MEIEFDHLGNLRPYEKVEMTLPQFKSIFVNLFDKNSSRHSIFENYQRYISDFKKQVSSEFTHWINSSFVSNKENPKDIDFVNTVDSEIVLEKTSLIESNFINAGVLKNYQIDAYLLIKYSEMHTRYIRTQTDLLY